MRGREKGREGGREGEKEGVESESVVPATVADVSLLSGPSGDCFSSDQILTASCTCGSEKSSGRLMDIWIDKQTGRQAGRQTDRQTDR